MTTPKDLTERLRNAAALDGAKTSDTKNVSQELPRYEKQIVRETLEAI